MNREMRRLMSAEERRQKKQKEEGGSPKRSNRGPRPGETKPPIWRRLWNFLREVRVELKKVSWPTRDQMVAFTTVTLITSTALTLVIFGLDVGLKRVVLFLIGGVDSG